MSAATAIPVTQDDEALLAYLGVTADLDSFTGVVAEAGAPESAPGEMERMLIPGTAFGPAWADHTLDFLGSRRVRFALSPLSLRLTGDAGLFRELGGLPMSPKALVLLDQFLPVPTPTTADHVLDLWRVRISIDGMSATLEWRYTRLAPDVIVSPAIVGETSIQNVQDCTTSDIRRLLRARRLLAEVGDGDARPATASRSDRKARRVAWVRDRTAAGWTVPRMRAGWPDDLGPPVTERTIRSFRSRQEAGTDGMQVESSD